MAWRSPALGSLTALIAKRQAASDLTAVMAARGRAHYPGPLLIRGLKAGRYNLVVIESMKIVLFSVALIVFVVATIMMLRSQ